jgi:hypothetical protein
MNGIKLEINSKKENYVKYEIEQHIVEWPLGHLINKGGNPKVFSIFWKLKWESLKNHKGNAKRKV